MGTIKCEEGSNSEDYHKDLVIYKWCDTDSKNTIQPLGSIRGLGVLLYGVWDRHEQWKKTVILVSPLKERIKQPQIIIRGNPLDS